MLYILEFALSLNQELLYKAKRLKFERYGPHFSKVVPKQCEGQVNNSTKVCGPYVVDLLH